MITLTFQIPDKDEDAITKLISERGGTLFVKTKDYLSKAEQLSLNQALNEAQKIKNGEMKALDFNDLWDE